MLTPEEYAKLTGKELTGLDFERTLKASLVLINSKTLHRFATFYDKASGAALEACNTCLAEVMSYLSGLEQMQRESASGKQVKAETVGSHRVEYTGSGKYSDDSVSTVSAEAGALVAQYLTPLGLTYRGVDVC